METPAGKNFDPDIVEIASDQSEESTEFDRLANYELFSYQLAKINEDIKSLKAERIFKLNIHIMRMVGLLALFLLVVAWLITICRFLYLSGHNPESYPTLQLSDPVIMALIGSTTVNVVGLFYIAARWLYGNPKPDKV